MNETATYIPGEGPLTYGRVLREAWGMFRRHYWRVAVVALILFVPPPLLTALLSEVRTALEADPGLVRGLGYVLGLLLATAIRLLGPVVYAGYLDEAVGHEYFGGHLVRFRTVIRTLPWRRLVVADIILLGGTAIGLALFVVPGLIWLTFFTLVGPVIVREHHGVVDGFRRTFQLARTAWLMILVLVVGLLAFENVAHELLHQQFHHSSLWLQIGSSWLVSAFIGGLVGLVEVALATELMARSPMKKPAND